MIKSHEDSNDGNDEFMHVCTIVIFLLIRFLYSLIHSLDCLLQFTQFYLMFINLLNFIIMFSLIIYCMQNHLFI